MEQQLAADVAKLLHDLQNRGAEAHVRKTAAEKLGELRINDERVIEALKIAVQSDENKYVRLSAEATLRNLGVELAVPGAAPQTTTMQLTERDLLEQLVKLHEKQNASLSEIQKHTGCLYAYLIVSVILGILYVLFILLVNPFF